MTTEKLFPSGMYCVSDVVGGRLIARRYMGYTKREAIALFKQEVRALKASNDKVQGYGVLTRYVHGPSIL